MIPTSKSEPRTPRIHQIRLEVEAAGGAESTVGANSWGSLGTTFVGSNVKWREAENGCG